MMSHSRLPPCTHACGVSSGACSQRKHDAHRGDVRNTFLYVSALVPGYQACTVRPEHLLTDGCDVQGGYEEP